MNIYSSLDELKNKKYAVSVGMYDGIHLGHQKMIDVLNKKAKEKGIESLVVTFEIHPKVVLNSTPPKLLMTNEEKVEYFKKLGVDNVLFLNFTKRVSKMGAAEFVEKVLVNRLNASVVV